MQQNLLFTLTIDLIEYGIQADLLRLFNIAIALIKGKENSFALLQGHQVFGDLYFIRCSVIHTFDFYFAPIYNKITKSKEV